MGLFGKMEEKPKEKTSLFGGKKDDKNIQNTNEFADVRGGNSGGIDGGSQDGGRIDNKSGNESSGKSDGDNNRESSGTNGGIANFTFASADNKPSGNDSSAASSVDGSDDESGDLSTHDAESVSQSNAEGNVTSRPVWLSKSEPKKIEDAKDIKIKKGSNKRSKNEGFLTEEQVKIIFAGIFDGIALLRGDHWKLDKTEMEIIPALTRIMNRIVDALPAKVAKHTFNIMDYVVVISCVAAIVMKRVNVEKGGKKVEHIQQVETSGAASSGNAPNGVSEGNQTSSGGHGGEPNGDGIKKQGVSNGFTSIAPIKDLASSIKSI